MMEHGGVYIIIRYNEMSNWDARSVAKGATIVLYCRIFLCWRSIIMFVRRSFNNSATRGLCNTFDVIIAHSCSYMITAGGALTSSAWKSSLLRGTCCSAVIPGAYGIIETVHMSISLGISPWNPLSKTAFSPYLPGKQEGRRASKRVACLERKQIPFFDGGGLVS
jgi:hypothetical protein